MVAVADPVFGPQPLDEEGREREQGQAHDVGDGRGEHRRGAPEDAVGEHAAAEDGDVRGADQGRGLFV